MLIILSHASIPLSFQGDWIYLGKSYLKMRRWEKRLSGKRIPFNVFITEESEKQRPHILEWIQKQREANNDSLYWWMTTLAGRNNLSSNFFDYLYQIAALKHWAMVFKNDPRHIHVLCEDGFLVRAAHQNLENILEVRLRINCLIGLTCDTAYKILYAIYTLIRQIWLFYSYSRAARKTRPTILELPKGEICLVHQCLDHQSFASDVYPIACRYFTSLPAWLESQGKQVIRWPWLYEFNLPLEEIFRQLRLSKCFIAEDWIGIIDYGRALLKGIKSRSAIREDISFKNLNVSALVKREKLQQLVDGIAYASFWKNEYALERWGRALDKLVVYDTYESSPPEHVHVYVGRKKMMAKTKFYGYYHSIVSKDYLGYHLPQGEEESIIFPDKIVVNGSLARDILIAQGLKHDRIIIGPALRQQCPPAPQVQNKNKDKDVLLLALSMIPESALEMMEKIGAYKSWITEKLNVVVLVKPHPMISKNCILKLMKCKDLPYGWEWYDGDIQGALLNARCAVTLNTAAIVDVVKAGCIPFPLSKSLGTPYNSLDLLSNEFSVVKTIEDHKIKSRLEDIFKLRRNFYDDEIKALQAQLSNLIEPVNELSMKAFI